MKIHPSIVLIEIREAIAKLGVCAIGHYDRHGEPVMIDTDPMTVAG